MRRKVANRISNFLKTESASGIILMFAALLALMMSNSFLSGFYDHLLHVKVAIQIGALKIEESLLHWINDGLMAVFFLLIGLEIKREIMVGELSTWKRASLPIFAAIGGMLFPALVYAYFNYDDPVTLHGWAIPAATDIAFALGILSLLGTRAPTSLKIFLLALAIIDDLGAIVIIALFYTSDLSLLALSLALVCIVVLFILNKLRVTRTAAYIIVGTIMWVCVLKSGVHATLAGVITAFFIPRIPIKGKTEILAENLEHKLHPWVAFGIMPIFAFGNAGVSFAGIGLDTLLEPVPLGIAAGLFIGKQIGVFAVTWSVIKAGLCQMPKNTTWLHIYGAALLTGIGFTMSLFIGTLAFEDQLSHAADIRLGVLLGSGLSGVLGYSILRFTKPVPQAESDDGLYIDKNVEDALEIKDILHDKTDLKS